MALGQILSRSLIRHDPIITPVGRTPSPPAGKLSKSLNRLLSAAVVSSDFSRLLLSDPVAALKAGYNGETFQLTPAEYAAVTSLRVNSVREFAAQLLGMLQYAAGETALHSPDAQGSLRFAEVGS